jgi:hypothetical protein
LAPFGLLRMLQDINTSKSSMMSGVATDMRVFIADDSAQIRERLIEMPSELPEVEITGEAEDTPEAIREIRRLDPDTGHQDAREYA